LPATAEYFEKRTQVKSGIGARCRDCSRAYYQQRARREAERKTDGVPVERATLANTPKKPNGLYMNYWDWIK
jgi:uncharacterized OB-fold protein